MQQRYCACGCVIWVRYVFPNLNCRIIFKLKKDGIERTLTCCPCCGKKLNIDALS